MILAMIRAYEGALTLVETVVTSANEVILLPVRRQHRRMFLEVFTLSAVLSAALYLFKCLALATDDSAAADLYLSLHDMNIGRVSGFIGTSLGSDHLRLLPLAYLFAGIAVGSATYIATVSAAVVAHRDSDQEKEAEELWEQEQEEEEEEEEEQEEEEEEEEEQEEEEEEEEEEQEEEDEEEEEKEKEGEEKKEQDHCTLLSFLGTVKSNLARPAKIICLSCVVRVALLWLLGSLGAGALERSLVVYPAAFIYFLLEFVFDVAVVASVAEKPAGDNAVRRACRVMWGKYVEFVVYVLGMGVIYNVFFAVCALVAMVGLPQQVDAGVMCLLLGAKQVFSVANMTGYYFACRKTEEHHQKQKHKQTKACHLE